MNFMPNLKVEGHELKVVETLKLLGTIVFSNLKWKVNHNT